MTKEEVLKKVETYCNEKSYTNETLTDGFKDKFADHFLKLNPDGDINDEAIVGNLEFALNTAFSGASEILTVKNNLFTSKETEYKNQIAELTKKLGKQTPPKDPPAIPKEVQDKLDEWEQFKTRETKREKSKSILQLAKKSIREDLHSSFDAFAEDFDASLEKEDKEQAEKLVSRFQLIFKETLGDIKPLAPRQTAQVEKEMLESVPKIEL
jgi:hypothetical protein